MSKRIVLLGHKARSGKDLLGSMLVSRDGYRRYAFADYLKEVVAELYELDKQQVGGERKDLPDTRYGITPRRILQDFGQEQRARHPSIWARHVAKQIDRSPFSSFVITDFRFPNEHRTLCDLFAPCSEVTTIKIHRPFAPAYSGADDISETALDDFKFDHVLVNDGTEEDLYRKYHELGL